MEDIDLTKAHVTLADGTIFQVLNDEGDYDDETTARVMEDYLEVLDGS